MAPAKVFISFRGRDVRHKFVSHLCTALRREKRVALLIDENFRRGRAILPEIKRAIKEAEISIIVLSSNYATSWWCLDEVVLILERHESRGQIVILVFYHVSKTDVEKQVGKFGAPFPGYEKKNPKKAKKWKAAVSKAVKIGGDGHLVVSNSPEAKDVDDIVRDVIGKINRLSFDEDSGLGSIKKRMKQVKHLLDAASDRICIISICGMGGIGKSKLSEYAYSQVFGEFDGCCVLSNFEEDELQQLIHMRNKGYSNVLILVDGMKKPQQVERLAELCDGFGVGSRIIVPTRNKQVFKGSGCRTFEVRTYEVDPLTSAEALGLLKIVAFDGNSPPDDYIDVVYGVINYADGNPQALKELGGFLWGKNKTQWESALEKLKKFPRSEMYNVFRSSFEELDDEEQTIFLDLAFLPRGLSLEYVTNMLNACNLDAPNGIEALVERFLVYIKDGCLYLHGLLEATAREIVRRESPKDPTRRSRVSNAEDILRVLDTDKRSGQVKVRGLYVDLSGLGKIQLKRDAFSNMLDLTFLIFYNSGCSGHCGDHGNIVQALQGLEPLPRSLRLMHWHNYRLPQLPDTKELFDLQLPCSNFGRNDEGYEELETDNCPRQCILS